MSPEVISLIVLILMFTVASIWPVNLGIMGFVAAFLVGTLAGGLSADDIFGGFPSSLFILLVGITLLFAIAQRNGTIDLLMDWGLRLVRGNVGFIPWIMFGLTTLLTSIGALSAAAVAIVAPVALRFAARYGIPPLMMGILVVQGATAGSFSPISPFGVVTNGVLEQRGLPQFPGLLFVNSLVFNALVAAAMFFAFGGYRLLRRQTSAERLSTGEREISEEEPAYATSESYAAHENGRDRSGEGVEENGLTWYRGATLAGIVLLVVGALGFDMDVGFAAVTIALALWLMAPNGQGGVLREMPWGVIVLVAGILTYVGVLQAIGTIDFMQNLIAGLGSDALAALAASYVGGLISAFAATAAVLGASIPLVEPILQGGSLSAVGVVTAVAISSAIVDTSPLSTNGALLLANVQNVEERVFFRRLLLWAVAVVVLAPLLLWLIFVVIGVP